MTEPENKEKKDLSVSEPGAKTSEEMDTAGRSLSEALGISFVILKVIMVVLVIAFLASGFKTVGSVEASVRVDFSVPGRTGYFHIRSMRLLKLK